MKKNLSSSRNHRSATIFSRKVYALLFVVLLFFYSDLAAGTRPVHKGCHFIKPESHNYKGDGNITRPDLNASAVKIKRSATLAAPTISYSSPQTYIINTAITPLAPTSSGVAATGYSSSAISYGSGFSQPAGVAVDAAGNVYVADNRNNAIKKIPAGGGTPVAIGSGFAFPDGVAVDAAGNVYVADTGNGTIKMIPAGGGATVVIGGNVFSSPQGVAVDAAGNVYVADTGDNAVKKIPTGGGATVTIGSVFNTPRAVAVDAAGNVY